MHQNLKRQLKYKYYKSKGLVLPKFNNNIFITCFPKSGSTYLSVLLSKLTGFELMDTMQFAKQNEQDIYEYKLRELVKKDTITQQHVKATENNISLLLKYGIKPIVLVRNIYDTIVSYYEHIENLDNRTSMGYIHKEYFHMKESDRYRFLIKVHLPWFFNFFVSWKEVGKDIEFLLITYEEVFSDQIKTIKKILEFYNLQFTDESINSTIMSINKNKTRFNKGIIGRGDKLSVHLKNEISSLAESWNMKRDDFLKIGIKK